MLLIVTNITNVPDSLWSLYVSLVKVEYHADVEYENPLKTFEKIACLGQRLLYLIMVKNTLPL